MHNKYIKSRILQKKIQKDKCIHLNFKMKENCKKVIQFRALRYTGHMKTAMMYCHVMGTTSWKPSWHDITMNWYQMERGAEEKGFEITMG